MRKKYLKAGICVITVLISTFMISNCCGKAHLMTQARATETVILLDPGHGGIDGGAVSSDGTPEKDINLKIALKVRDLAEEYDCRVIMTRSSDESLCDGDEGSIRAMKTADLRARREMMREFCPSAAVSIHLNSFREDTSVKGAQVFYPGGLQDQELSSSCKIFAEKMQTAVSQAAGGGNERVPMPKADVFLFKDEICPLVIVECGFLSNREESELLKKDAYQQKMAEGIMDGIVEFTGIEEVVRIEVIDSLCKKNKR